MRCQNGPWTMSRCASAAGATGSLRAFTGACGGVPPRATASLLVSVAILTEYRHWPPLARSVWPADARLGLWAPLQLQTEAGAAPLDDEDRTAAAHPPLIGAHPIERDGLTIDLQKNVALFQHTA